MSDARLVRRLLFVERWNPSTPGARHAVIDEEEQVVLVNGEDDLAHIPEGAPTYITHRVRETLETWTIRGKILPAARTISVDTARRIFDFMVHANARAFQAMREPSAAESSRQD